MFGVLVEIRGGKIHDRLQSRTKWLCGPIVLVCRLGQSCVRLGPRKHDESIIRDDWCALIPKELFIWVVLNYNESARCYKQEVRISSSIIGVEHPGDVHRTDLLLTMGAPGLNSSWTIYDFIESSRIMKAYNMNRT